MTLYEYPAAAAFGKIVPKDRICEHGAASPDVRKLFVSQVAQIRWKYKLAPETVNVDATPAVPEIQIFSLALKEQDLSPHVLLCLDKAVYTPVVCELRYENLLRVAAAPKQCAGEKKNIGEYFFSPWMPADSPRVPLPLTLDLSALYGLLLSPLIPYPRRQEESLDAWMNRLRQIREKQKETAALETKLRREKQFSRQIPINRELRNARRQLASLCQA